MQPLKMMVVKWDLRHCWPETPSPEEMVKESGSVVQWVYVIYRFLPIQGIGGPLAAIHGNWKAVPPMHEIIEVSDPFRIEGLCAENGKVRLELLQRIDKQIADIRAEQGLEEVEPPPEDEEETEA